MRTAHRISKRAPARAAARMPNRAPIAVPHSHAHRSPQGNPLYAYGYNPTWPSILSIGHDEEDGSRLFVITDRPCVLSGPPFTLPLVAPDNGAPLTIIAAQMVLPVKCRVGFSDAVPAHAPWRWAGGFSSLYDPITGHYPNAGAGDCADYPGPYTPPPPPGPPTVVSTAFSGNTVNLIFDQPVEVSGSGPDDSITINGIAPISVGSADAYTLYLAMPDFVNAGDAWVIARQPDWVVTEIVVPESGVL